MGYHHITTYQRICIRGYLNAEFNISKIARLLGVNKSTISREIARNSVDNEYKPIEASRIYLKRRKQCHKIIKLTPEIKKHIEDRVDLTWSPEQIVGRIEEKPSGFPSTSTIYHWIHKGYIVAGGMKKLRYKGRFKQKHCRSSGVFQIGRSIRKRPRSVYKREEVGHWEGDTVVGKAGTKPCFVTLLERKSRYYVAECLTDRTANNVNDGIFDILGGLPSKIVKTITVDRGREFARWRDIEQSLGCKTYFADAYCAWQKGSNENTNGLLREFFPKKQSLVNVTPEELEHALHLLNNRPRKCLNYRTPAEVFREEISKL